MSRKRKVEATRLDEVDRTLYSTFCGAANSLSQLYTQAMNQQKISFQAGERHALEKLYQWIIRRHEEGSRISVADIVAQIQNEMDYAGDDTLVSQRSPFQQQHQSTMQLTNSSLQPASSFLGQPALGPPRTGHTDHARNSVFSNALSSPVRRSLQPFQLPQGGGFSANGSAPNGNAASRNHDGNHNGDTDPLSNSNDSSMDIHTDIPPHRFY